jgi:hypothetical protein
MHLIPRQIKRKGTFLLPSKDTKYKGVVQLILLIKIFSYKMHMSNIQYIKYLISTPIIQSDLSFIIKLNRGALENS